MQSVSLSVSLLAQSFCRSITHTAEQDPTRSYSLHHLTVHYLQQSQRLTCIKASPISAAVYGIIIYDASPTTQYTQTAGSCIIIVPH